jgi:hypothetical protein
LTSRKLIAELAALSRAEKAEVVERLAQQWDHGDDEPAGH